MKYNVNMIKITWILHNYAELNLYITRYLINLYNITKYSYDIINFVGFMINL